jgi:signal transduction histidine kinase
MNEKKKTKAELIKELLEMQEMYNSLKELKLQCSNELEILNKKLVILQEENEKRTTELAIANEELVHQNEIKEKRAEELIIANKELAFQNEEKEKRAIELAIANEELAHQNAIKEKRAEELIIANKELAIQNQEKERHAAEFVIANEELAYQNKLKEKRAEELIIAIKELAFQNEEKGKRAAELVIANEELAYQNELKEKRTIELMIARDTAEASDRLKTAFMNNISHEIRTPLNGILGFAPFIIQPDITLEEREEFLEVLFDSSNRLLNTINNIMDISLIISGNMEVHSIPIDILPILTKVFKDFQESGMKKNLEFKMEFPEMVDTFILNTDGEILRKAISKLVDNAVKFTKEGSITLGFELINNEIEIFVKDTGEGIEKDSQERIYKSFMQENIHNTRGHEGAGLGLSISKGLMQLLGGKIRLDSIKNSGTTVTLTLPIITPTDSSEPINKT